MHVNGTVSPCPLGSRLSSPSGSGICPTPYESGGKQGQSRMGPSLLHLVNGYPGCLGAQQGVHANMINNTSGGPTYQMFNGLGARGVQGSPLGISAGFANRASPQTCGLAGSQCNASNLLVVSSFDNFHSPHASSSSGSKCSTGGLISFGNGLTGVVSTSSNMPLVYRAENEDVIGLPLASVTAIHLPSASSLVAEEQNGGFLATSELTSGPGSPYAAIITSSSTSSLLNSNGSVGFPPNSGPTIWAPGNNGFLLHSGPVHHGLPQRNPTAHMGLVGSDLLPRHQMTALLSGDELASRSSQSANAEYLTNGSCIRIGNQSCEVDGLPIKATPTARSDTPTGAKSDTRYNGHQTCESKWSRAGLSPEAFIVEEHATNV
ncbi:unnamed protein product [Protopolystoma xenopodis]|uniref:Uncharacterized protein n=1 Tax=Protopolystoma xenopodis TaxID=117903 RepID=A0A3S5BL79_9PLAT|nr:unnamed protein product [Protopolystoma xenopodis]